MAPWMLGLVLLGAAAARGNGWSGLLKAEPWQWALGFFLLFCLFSVINSLDVFLTLRRWGNLVLCGGLALAVSLTLRRGVSLGQVAEGATAAAVLVAAAALLLYGLEVQGLRPVAFEAIYKTGIPRAHGTFNDPNMLGQWMVAFLPLAIGLFLARGRGRVLPRWSLLAAAGVMSAAVALSFSRGAMLGIVLGYLAFYRSFRVVAALVAATAAGVLLGGEALWSRLTGTLTVSDFSTNERLLLWQSALRMMVDHPWVGVGLNHFPLRYFEYLVPGAPRRVSFPHNIYLEIGAEAGILALIAFLAIIVAVYVGLARTLIAVDGRPERHLVRALGVGLTAVLLHDMTTQGLVQPQLWILLGLSAGAATAMRAVSGSDRSAATTTTAEEASTHG